MGVQTSEGSLPLGSMVASSAVAEIAATVAKRVIAIMFFIFLFLVQLSALEGIEEDAASTMYHCYFRILTVR